MININRYTKIAMAMLLPAFNMESAMRTFNMGYAMHNSNMECEENRSSPTNVVDIVRPQKRKYSTDVFEPVPDLYKRQCNEESVIIDDLVFEEDDQAALEEIIPNAPRDQEFEVLDCSSTLPNLGSGLRDTAEEEMEIG